MMFGSGCSRQRADHVRERIVEAASLRRCRWICATTSCNKGCSRHRRRQLALPRVSSYHVARRVPLGLTERFGCHWGLVWSVSVFNLNGALKVDATVGGTDVIDVPGIACQCLLGIDQVNEIAERSRLTPALCRQ